MSPNTCWLCKIFRAEENGISSKVSLEEVLQWSQSFENLVTSKYQEKGSSQHKPLKLTPEDWHNFQTAEKLQRARRLTDSICNSKDFAIEILNRKQPNGPMVYKTYLKTEHSDENIEFWLACEAYKKITSHKKRISMARKLFTSYIQPQAPNEINIDSPARKAIIRNIQEPTQSCFDEAQRIIYRHMERDSYPRFLESQFYQKLKHSLQTNGNNSTVN